jgi:hypothetical protein
MKMRSTLVMGALLCLAVALPGSNVLAQQKQQVSFKIPAENSKYTVSQNVDVGDVPNHIVRVFESHATLPNNAAAISGLKLVEMWQRGITDIIDGNGNSTNYFVFVAENGDKFFVRNAAVASSSSGKITATTVGHITGGTGRLAGIQGVLRQVVDFDPRPGGVPGDGQSKSSTRSVSKHSHVTKNKGSET